MASRTKEKRPLPLPVLPSEENESEHRSLLPVLTLVASLFLFFFFSFWLLLSYSSYLSPQLRRPTQTSGPSSRAACGDSGDIASFYIYDLPDRLDGALLRRCRDLSPYADMCPHVANGGLGRPVPHRAGWFATHQFVAEVLFRARAERHPCRTFDPDSAALFYVPFYAGLYASSVLAEENRTLRDALGVDLARHVSRLPAFRRSGGRDHFLVSGRTAWDLMRSVDPRKSAASSANRLLRLPELANVSVLTVERHPWEGRTQFGIPYPSYFHPASAEEVAAWQEEARRAERAHLFAFVGGARTGGEKEVVRALASGQCGASSRCIRVECGRGGVGGGCHAPGRVVAALMGAEFCLQPQGDTFTRRSVFDSVLAGCVPVFFSRHTAYTQYAWYVPRRAEEWSVFLVPERRGRIEEELSRIPKAAAAAMREAVIRMIPRVTYAHPNASWADGRRFRDAVDVALAELTKRARARVRSSSSDRERLASNLN